MITFITLAQSQILLNLFVILHDALKAYKFKAQLDCTLTATENEAENN